MRMWSPYVSNYDNPLGYQDILGDSGIVPFTIREQQEDARQKGFINGATQQDYKDNPVRAAERFFIFGI
jgi:hypothetical protein